MISNSSRPSFLWKTILLIIIIGNDRFPPCAKHGESPPTQATDGKFSQQSPTIHTDRDNNCSGVNTDDTVCGQVTQMCPLYAVPDKLKSKQTLVASNSKLESDKSLCQQTEKSCDVQGLQNEFEEVYCSALTCTHVELRNIIFM